MDSSWNTTYRAARRQYELGRLRGAVARAAVVVLLVAAVTGFTVGRSALVWLPLTFAVAVFTEWQGRVWMKGARRGLGAGFVALVLPLSILRPCCAADRMAALSASCCTMPSVCWVAGGALGLALSVVLPKDAAGRRWEAALGTLLGVTSVTVVRCSGLFLAEAAGLLGGVLAGVIGASLARALLDRTRLTV
jgi:integral membrane sensor domain MASE1